MKKSLIGMPVLISQSKCDSQPLRRTPLWRGRLGRSAWPELDDVEHLLFGHEAAAERVPARLAAGVAAVGQHHHDAASAERVEQGHRLVHGVEETRRIGEAMVFPERAKQHVAVAGEVRADDDLVVEGADRGAIARTQPDDELLGGDAGPFERGGHAGAGVDEHDRRNRLQAAGKVRDRLAVSVVEDLEIVASE